MGSFFAELKRRHIYQVTAAYIVVAWVLLQLFNNLEPILKLPDWAGTLVLVFLLGGFPIALVFAWTLELKAAPSGADGPSLQIKSARVAETQQTGVALPQPALFARTGVISIAVLPFANMSGDASQEFFSDGMTEEITAALAQIKQLRVVGRTSAFQFKGQNKELRAIGQALGASYLIEGSVRKAGNRVRITAQLVHAGEDTHLWAQSYDRELIDVFAVQEDIAQAIAASLQMPLGLKQGEHLVSNRSIDPDSYQQFLRAKALVRARGFKPLTDAAVLLEQVVARDRDYAPAWALLSLAYVLAPNYHPAWLTGDMVKARSVIDASMPKAETAARRAIKIDPKNAEGYVALAYVQAMRAKLLQAEELFLKALALDDCDPDALHFYGLLLAAVGRLKEAIAMRQRLQTLEPFVPNFNVNTAYVYWVIGQAGEALALLKDVPPEFAFGQWFRAWMSASFGRYGEAADTVQAITVGTTDDVVRLLRTAPTPATSPQTLPRLGIFAFVYLHVGAPSRALEFYEDNVEAGYSAPGTIAYLWHASYAPVRKTERFKTFARKAGLVDYWRVKGWPYLCHPTGDDFSCD